MEKSDSFLTRLISDFENKNLFIIEKRAESKVFELMSDPFLLDNLSGGVGAYVVRSLLGYLGVDEHQIFRYRLENKYVQYLVFSHYIPDAAAQTFSLSYLLAEENGAAKVSSLCENGYFIKATLGDSSGRKNLFDRTAELDYIIDNYKPEYNDKEKWMVQERLDLREEFRIHSFGHQVIYGLGFRINGSGSDGQEALAFVESILKVLPDAVVGNSLIGWDIGITNSGKLYIIEANFTGFHPEYERGFQTSGYFQDGTYGPVVCAWLNNYFKNTYNMSIGAVESKLLSQSQFFAEFLFYSSVLTKEHLHILRNKRKIGNLSVILYLEEYPNPLYITLLKYFYMINLATTFYLIIKDEAVPEFNELAAQAAYIDIIGVQSLFSRTRYREIQELEPEKRRQAILQPVINVLEDGKYIVL
jgi:hypothetical protein